MTLDEFRQQFETYRAAVDKEAKALRDSYFALEHLHALYEGFDPDERAMADQVLTEWATSQDEALRFDALALIDDYRIVSAIPALMNLTSTLASSTAIGASFELEKVTSIISRLRAETNYDDPHGGDGFHRG